MAMILDVLVSTVVEKLVDTAIKEIASILGLKSEMKKLRTKISKIKLLLVDAGSKKIESRSINLWLAEFREVMYDTEDLLDDFQVHADKVTPARATSRRARIKAWLRSVPGFSQLLSLPFRHEIATRIKNINSTLDRLSLETQNLGLLEKLPNADKKVCSYSSSRMSDTSSKQLDSDVVGIDDDATKLVDRIIKNSNQTNSIFAITGMGGIGKTTLARKVFNLVEKEEHFNDNQLIILPIWVHVSRNCTGEYLLKEIVRSIDESYSKTSNSHEELSSDVIKVVQNKSVFIVLDDIWDSCLWEKFLRVPLLHERENYSTRILITTRNENVAKKMDVVYMHRMRKMLLEDGWSMLCKNVFNKEDKSDMIDQLEEIGKKIVEKCEHLPLAIKVVGGVLKMKDRTTFAWEKVCSSEIWLMKDLDKDILASLLLSYEDLPSHLKQCFTYFAVFSKDLTYSCHTLVSLWIAEGFIEKVEGKDVEESGRDCYKELMTRNLLQSVPMSNFRNELITLSDIFYNGATMHDLLRSLTIFLSKKEYIYVQHSDSIKLRHLCFSSIDLDAVPNKIMKQDYVRTLFLSWNPQLKTITSALLSHLRRLRVLDLENTGIETLPEEFGTLIQLKYLNISHTKLKELPESIKNLKNLEILIALGLEDLHSLPMGITELINLRVIHVDRLYSMPPGMDNMKNLRYLKCFVVNKGTCSEGGSQPTTNIKELKDLSQLTTLVITNLERVATEEEAKESAIEKKTRLEILGLRSNYEEDENFDDKDIEKNEKVFAGLKVPLNLKELGIYGFYGKQLPSHILNANSLGQLIFLELDCFLFVKQLPCLGDLPKLERLVISLAPSVTELGPEFFGSSKFPRLQFLQLKEMIILEKMFEVEQGAFPCLVKLLISECPNLKSLKEGWQHAKCLETLEVEGLGNLESIENFNSISELKLKYNSRLTSVKNLPSLKIMTALDCPALKEVKDVGELKELHYSGIDEEQISPPQWVEEMSPSPKELFQHVPEYLWYDKLLE